MTTQTKDTLHYDAAQHLQLHAMDFKVLQQLHRATNSRYLLDWDHENQTAQEYSCYIADMIQDMRNAMKTSKILTQAVNYMRWQFAKESGEAAKKAVWEKLNPGFEYEPEYGGPLSW